MTPTTGNLGTASNGMQGYGMYDHHIPQTGHQHDTVANIVPDQLNRKITFSLSPFAPENWV